MAQNACATWGCVDKIEKLLTWHNGTVWVYSEADTTQLDCGATEPDQTRKKILIFDNMIGSEKMYAQLLSAKAQEKSMKLRIVNGSDPCSINYMETID
jgi:hypothetical protein